MPEEQSMWNLPIYVSSLHAAVNVQLRASCASEINSLHLNMPGVEFFRRRYSTQTKYFKKITAIKCSNEQFTATLLEFFCFIYT